MPFKVINIDCDGKIIPDLSKVILPKELSEELFNILRRNEHETIHE
jgi:hypothetical protein